MRRYPCAHCGLPVVAEEGADPKRLFCCTGCRLARRIVGEQGGEGAPVWTLLRLGVGALLAMNVMMISLLLYTNTVEPQALPAFRWLLLGLSTPAVLVLGLPFLLGAAGEVRRLRFGLDTLIATGSFAAFAVGAVNVVRGAGLIYFDTATMLLVLVTFGRLIEAAAKSRAGKMVRGLETLLPARATRCGPDGLTDVDTSAIRPGDRIFVKPGERFAADGRIVEGETIIEEAAFTGDARPRACATGDDVLAGTVNGLGGVIVEATRVGKDLLLSRIIEMVESARREPSRSERIAERVAAWFVPAVLVLAAAAAAVWFFIEGPARAGFVALATLVVACPCAMGIATPLATALAVARAAREGVLVRGGDVMERVGRVRTFFLDKTGTVTAGRPSIVHIEPLDPGLSGEELLGWLAGLESGSEHALARAAVEEAKARGIEIGTVRGLEASPGLGVRGLVERGGVVREVTAGTDALVGAPPFPAEAAGPQATVVGVAWDGKLRGRIYIADSVRAGAAEAVRRLHEAGVQTVLLSGDRLEAARAVGEELGVTRVEAPRRPDEKIESIREAARSGATVGMVGDGINDAPALAASDVGIALGAGTDLARQAGHVVLLSDRLTQIPWLVSLSRRTRRVIVQNLVWVFGYNAVALAAAAAGFLHPLLAAVLMTVSSVTVVSNSLRLRNFPPDE